MPLIIVRNDITKMKVDTIVNAANETLLGGGGVDGCIHRAAGPELLQECRTLGGCRTGEAKITGAYRLPCKYVIHTVGPVWNGGKYGEREQLASCYRTSLALAKEYGCETVAFPLISSGVFGYPKDQALRVAVDAISEFLAENDMTVYIVIFDRAAYQIGNKLFADIAAYIDDHYVDAHTDSRRERMRRMGVVESRMLTAYGDAPMATSGLDEALAHLDAGFSETLLKLIDRSGKKDAEVYKKANVDRKLFSKIRNNPDYKPSKPTAVAFAIALELSLPETRDLIAWAGYEIATKLHELLNMDTFDDFRNFEKEALLEIVLRSVRGMGDAGVNYMFMMAGDPNRCKPDVHIHRCIKNALGTDVPNNECQILFRETVKKLKDSGYPDLTVRNLDSVIWNKYQKNRSIF